MVERAIMRTQRAAAGGRPGAGFQLAMPVGLTAAEAAGILDDHFAAGYSEYGASRLPVLAVHAAYRQLVQEVKRYRGCRLGPLRPPAAKGSRTEPLGDVEVFGRDGHVCEAVEVRHSLPITPQMVRSAFDRFKSRRRLERYYILSTSEKYDVEAVSDEILEAGRRHDCQIIANGTAPGLKYHLRMPESADGFVEDYVKLLGEDEAVAHEHRKTWNRIAGRGAYK